MEELFGDEWYDQNREYIDDIRLPVFEMRSLPREVRMRFRSDMRFVADCLAQDEENIPKHQKVLHVPEMLRMLKNITGDERYTEIVDSVLEKQKERGGVEMCEILDKYINRGIETGRREGIAALISTLKELGRAYGETMDKVREKFGLSETEARKTMEKYW